MPERGIMLGLMTPQGPIFVGFSVEDFAKFAEMLNTIKNSVQKETPIPKVFEDAFKEVNDGNAS